MRYRSKVDAWLVATLLVSALMTVTAVVVAAGQSSGAVSIAAHLATLLVAVGLPIWLLLSTYYQIGDDCLLVHSGPFRWRIPLASITSITPTRSMLSGPALSLDRLRIEYGADKVLLVSPRDHEAFVKALTRAVPA